MNQPALPVAHLRVPMQHVHYLRWANGGNYRGKEEWFYPFKWRFLEKHALPDGCDLQVIKQKCWCGDGIFRGVDYDLPRIHWDICWKCNGTGVYRTKKIVLQRWLLCGVLFHVPSNSLQADFGWLEFKETITGLVTHSGYGRSLARHAFCKLLWIYEPDTLWRMLREQWVNGLDRRERNLRRKWEKMRYQIRDYFWPDDSEDEVPF